MNDFPIKPRRWFCVIPMNFVEQPCVWERDGGLLCQALRGLGVDAKYVALGKPCLRQDVPLILCTLPQMQKAAWWKQWELEVVLLYTWAMPRYEPIARAIKSAGIRIILVLDTEGFVSPQVSAKMYFRQKFYVEKEGGQWWANGRALLKASLSTLAATLRVRHGGTLRHLAHADLIVLPSPLAKQRYNRFLLAMGRRDLAERLRCLPYAVMPHMSYDPGPAKKPQIVAVGRWESPQKNGPLLIRVLGQVLSEHRGYSARIIGGGTESLRKHLGNLPADCLSRIELVGPVENQRLPALFGESQILLCTSRYESFMIAAAEALCCGCSVVGDARVASMSYFAGPASGTVSCGSSVGNFRDALMAEIDAWQEGGRDPKAISQIWQSRVRADRVAAAFLRMN